MFENENLRQEDRVLAYQLKNNKNYEEAELELKEIDYNNLVCCGISPEQAKNIIYGEEQLDSFHK